MLGAMADAPTVMIVDDNPAIRDLIRAICMPHTRAQVVVADGLEAVEAFQQSPFDVVVMDVEMPRMNGLDATRQILLSHPTARIIIVTQHASEAFREAAEDSGACGFLPKDRLSELPDILTTQSPFS